jgi:AraC-like DNA-binding protein
MQISLISALYLVGLAQSTYLLLVVPRHRGRPLLQLFLGALTLLMADYFVWENGWLSEPAQFWTNRFTHASLTYLLGPTLYLYIRLQADESFHLSRRYLWHGLPYVLGVLLAIFVIPVYLPSYRTYTQNWLFPAHTWPQLLRGIHVMVYAWLGGCIVWRQLRQQTSPFLGSSLAGAILVLACGSMLMGTGTYLQNDSYALKFYWQCSSVLCAVSMVYLITRWLAGQQASVWQLSVAETGLPQHAAVESAEKYQRSALDPTTANRFFEKLNTHLSTTRAYQNPDLTLPQLAQTLALPTNQLSQIINQAGGQTFYELINHYRIEAACRLLADPTQQHLSVLGIGYEVGFQSKSTYYAAFRRVKRLTPNAYRKQYNQK